MCRSAAVTVLTAGLLALAAGCANEPIIDRRGVDEAKYRADLAECRAYAEEVNTAGETATSGAAGAAIGASIGAILGNSGDAAQGAGVGAVAGGSKGFSKAEHRKERVMYRCLEHRGYKVLG